MIYALITPYKYGQMLETSFAMFFKVNLRPLIFAIFNDLTGFLLLSHRFQMRRSVYFWQVNMEQFSKDSLYIRCKNSIRDRATRLYLGQS